MTATMVPLVGKQIESVKLAHERLNLWEGSVRSSKTICSLLAWLVFVRTGPAGNLVMIGKTERTLKRNVIDPLTSMLGAKRCKANWGDGELMLMGRRIYLAGANNEAAIGKIQGLTLAGAYVDEATLMPEGMWSMLLTRLSIEGAQLFATCNPDNPNHWLMRDYLKRAAVWLRHDGTVERSKVKSDLAVGVARFSFRLADNPTLPATYIAALEAQFTGLWRLRYVQGLWVLAEGAIYDGFDPSAGAGHVVADLPRKGKVPAIRTWAISVDYGTTNPFVALLLAVGMDDRIYVASEYRYDSRAEHGQHTDAEHSAAMKRWLARNEKRLGVRIDPEVIAVDPSAASFIAQLWRDGWSRVDHADNTVADGIRDVATLIGGDHLAIVGPQDSGGIAEMTGYVWDSKAAKQGLEQPLKVDDHYPDALRYGVRALWRHWRHWLTIDLSSEAA